MEDIFNPIITKMYKDAGAGPQPGIIYDLDVSNRNQNDTSIRFKDYCFNIC